MSDEVTNNIPDFMRAVQDDDEAPPVVAESGPLSNQPVAEVEALLRALDTLGVRMSEALAGATSRTQSVMAKVKDAGDHPVLLGKLYRGLRDFIDLMEGPWNADKTRTGFKPIGQIKDFTKAVLIPESFEANQVKTITLDDGSRVTRTEKVVVHIPKETRPLAIQWLRDSGHGDLVIETVNAGTLNSFAKAELEEGRQLPEELFKVTLLLDTSLTRKK